MSNNDNNNDNNLGDGIFRNNFNENTKKIIAWWQNLFNKFVIIVIGFIIIKYVSKFYPILFANGFVSNIYKEVSKRVSIFHRDFKIEDKSTTIQNNINDEIETLNNIKFSSGKNVCDFLLKEANNNVLSGKYTDELLEKLFLKGGDSENDELIFNNIKIAYQDIVKSKSFTDEDKNKLEYVYEILKDKYNLPVSEDGKKIPFYEFYNFRTSNANPTFFKTDPRNKKRVFIVDYSSLSNGKKFLYSIISGIQMLSANIAMVINLFCSLYFGLCLPFYKYSNNINIFNSYMKNSDDFKIPALSIIKDKTIEPSFTFCSNIKSVINTISTFGMDTLVYKNIYMLTDYYHL